MERGLAELSTGIKARELGLPVAELAAVAGELLPSKRWAMEAWGWWKANTLPFPSLLKKEPLSPVSRGRLLQAVAETIRLCHEAGLLHGDLNANNIIVKPESEGFHAALVDLDKCIFLPIMPHRLKLAQLRRLYRSLAKEGIIPSVLPEEEFALLVRTYFGNELPESELAAFMRGCRARAHLHSLLWRR